MGQNITLQPGESVTITAAKEGGPSKPSGGGGGSTTPDSAPTDGTPGDVQGNTLNYAVPWVMTTEYLRTKGFKGDMTLVIGFMIPANAPAGQKGRASGAEYGGGPNSRDACISTKPGSFTDGVVASTTQNPSPLFWLNVGKEVTAGVTYYMNIKNSSPSSNMTEMSCQVTITN